MNETRSWLTQIGVLLVLAAGLLARPLAGQSDGWYDKARADIENRTREAAYWQQQGNQARADQLRRDAAAIYRDTMRRLMEERERKLRAAAAAGSGINEERVAAAAEYGLAIKETWDAGSSMAEWTEACVTPVSCLAAIDKAKDGIDSAFSAAEHAVETNVHLSNADFAQKLQGTKQAEAEAANEKERRLTEFESELDARPPRSEEPPLPPSVPANGELGQPSQDDFERAKKLAEEGPSFGKTDPEGRIGTPDTSAKTTSQEALDQAGAGAGKAHESVKVETDAGLGRLADIEKRNADAANRAGGQPMGGPGPGGKGAGGNGAGPADHCPGGAFVCPNGNPWEKCTHPEKWSCPPPGAGKNGKPPAGKPSTTGTPAPAKDKPKT
jgi:hypothetical protein